MTTRKKKKVTKPTIYVQIAAYRDPELLNTLRDCLVNAKYPENLRIGIAWQHSPYEEWDTLGEFKTDPRFHIIDIDYRDAKGPCWARHKLNKAYKNETYALQLDSHHRFSIGWDITLISMLEGLRTKACPKPLLSSYLPSFDPKNDQLPRMETPWIMEFDRFAPESPIHFLPRTVDDYKERTKPIPSRFISGHFIFADGKFCQEVEYDPKYYFHGEEINLSVRAYMAGYDLFTPHRAVIWHEYTRDNKKKHWDDHGNWNQLDTQSHKHNREIFGIDNTHTEKTLTTHVRTLQDYEQYAGVDFGTRRVHTKTLDKVIPPVSLTFQEHQDGLVRFHRMCIDIYKELLKETDYTLWAVALEDKHGNEIYRVDLSSTEIQRILSVPFEMDKFAHVWANCYADELPATWVVWPHSESKGWCERLTGKFNI